MTEGGSGTRIHRIWKGMKGRCQTPSASGFAYYGGRGIKVCKEWQTFLGFLDWALATGYADDLEIDRIDADLDYSPTNCRWVSPDINRDRRRLDRRGGYLAELRGTLTDEAIDAATPGARPFRMWDGEGLYLEVLTTGRRVWRWKFRFEGKERLLTIGPYPTIPIHAARERVRVSKVLAQRGTNPASKKR